MGFFARTETNGRHGISRDLAGCLDRLGWSIGGRPSESAVLLQFKGDHITPQRELIVDHAPGNCFMIFVCSCRADFSEDTLPVELPGVLLARNKKGIGYWYAAIRGERVEFAYRYLALAAGVTPTIFQNTCERMAQEVAEVENGMRHRGLL